MSRPHSAKRHCSITTLDDACGGARFVTSVCVSRRFFDVLSRRFSAGGRRTRCSLSRARATRSLLPRAIRVLCRNAAAGCPSLLCACFTNVVRSHKSVCPFRTRARSCCIVIVDRFALPDCAAISYTIPVGYTGHRLRAKRSRRVTRLFFSTRNTTILSFGFIGRPRGEKHARVIIALRSIHVSSCPTRAPENVDASFYQSCKRNAQHHGTTIDKLSGRSNPPGTICVSRAHCTSGVAPTPRDGSNSREKHARALIVYDTSY